MKYILKMLSPMLKIVAKGINTEQVLAIVNAISDAFKEKAGANIIGVVFNKTNSGTKKLLRNKTNKKQNKGV